jgi:hypothetical protein
MGFFYRLGMALVDDKVGQKGFLLHLFYHISLIPSLGVRPNDIGHSCVQ